MEDELWENIGILCNEIGVSPEEIDYWFGIQVTEDGRPLEDMSWKNLLSVGSCS